MRNTVAVLVITGLILSGCTQGEEAQDQSLDGTEEISADIINNPKTISEDGEAELDPDELPEITFEQEEQDFGTIEQGDNVEHTFKFTNTGNTDLVIAKAQASCGCTVPYWPREPIRPGESSEIRVTYHSKGKSGKQRKSITVTSNTVPNKKTIYITGEVTVPGQ